MEPLKLLFQRQFIASQSVDKNGRKMGTDVNLRLWNGAVSNITDASIAVYILMSMVISFSNITKLCRNIIY